jgi:DEAD/DEAH box helicase domain-containing protein
MHKKTLENILASQEFFKNIEVHRHIPAQKGVFAPFPQDVQAQVLSAFNKKGVFQLYSHQNEVWQEVQKGNSTIVVTPTASGKTVCYNLPVLDELIKNPESRALYLFPTKALSQDQQAELNELIVQGELPIKVATYDGDTPTSLRVSARDKGQIIISNPDMLHSGVLPNHTKWIRFFSSLKYIVIDEVHSYRGIFGSHVANVIRRLQRICQFYGSKPLFILCSATIANPREHGQALIGQRLSLVDKNGAPQGPKDIVLYNPKLIDAVQGIRRGLSNEGRRWAVHLLKQGVKTILFARSRTSTELIASYINEALHNMYTDNDGIKVFAYRGGLLPNERRAIEKGLRNGDIMGVVSTNALELGIDIGNLDAAVIAGFPGSFSSFWQQAGRSGRRGDTALVVFIASASPLDQYLIAHSDWFFNSPNEAAHINPDNPYVLSDHVKCAAFEIPFKDGDEFGQELQTMLAYLQEQGVLRHVRRCWHWADRGYPAEGISLRSASEENVVIIDTTAGRDTVIGEMDRPSAKELLFKNAVYIHGGRQYLVEKLDIQNRRAVVREEKLNYYTDAIVKRDIKPLSIDISQSLTEAENGTAILQATLGDALVRSEISKFKKIRFHTHENIGYGDIYVEEEELHTRALFLIFDESSIAGTFFSSLPPLTVARCLRGLANLISHIAPLWLLCDPRDLGHSERAKDGHFLAPALFIWDRYPGGTGLVEALLPLLPSVFRASLELILACNCSQGCPSCIGIEDDFLPETALLPKKLCKELLQLLAMAQSTVDILH